MTTSNGTFPPQIDYRLPGWDLYWIELEITGATSVDAPRKALPKRINKILRGYPLAEHPTVHSVRSLFRNAGCDPTRHRPSSEALVRRLLKGDPLPAILPAVDISNLWSVELLVPCCVINPKKISGPLLLRRGQSGETMESMRGPLNLENKPVLFDRKGPFGTPITDAERVKVSTNKGTFWLVAYLPTGVIARDFAHQTLASLCDDLPHVTIRTASS